MRIAILAALAVLGGAIGAAAENKRDALGTARLFTNDYFGDGSDRWHTGGYQVSHFRGQHWSGDLGSSVGEVLEYRFRSEIIAPEDLRRPAAGDRRYAGVLSFGLHTPFSLGEWDVSVGGDLVLTGPQTGIGEFQDTIHDWLNAPRPDLSNQIENGFHPTVVATASKDFVFGRTVLRPFAEVQAGFENYARIGGDVLVGSIGMNGLFARDYTTGTLIRADHKQDAGFSFLLGADYAAVQDSVLLPSSDGFEVTDRGRARAGLQWQGDQRRVYYGLTYLSEEFEAQDTGQLVGSLTVDFSF